MTGPLTGLTILVPESRELDLFVAMLEAEGAAAWRCPLLRILDLEAPHAEFASASKATPSLHLSPEGRGRVARQRDPSEGEPREELFEAVEIPPRLRGGWPREARPGGAPLTDPLGSSDQTPRLGEDPTPTLPEDGEGDASVSIAGMDEPRRTEVPHGDLAQAEAWIDALIAGRFDDTIWLTGEGLRRLLDIAERTGRRVAFTAALGRVRLITRGPKPARVLRELGLAPNIAATTPTSQGVLDALAGEDLHGRRIGVQLYPGDGALPLVAALGERGAAVFPVTPYRYADQADDAQVVEAIRALADGRIGMVAFTSSPQVERLFDVGAHRRPRGAAGGGPPPRPRRRHRPGGGGDLARPRRHGCAAAGVELSSQAAGTGNRGGVGGAGRRWRALTAAQLHVCSVDRRFSVRACKRRDPCSIAVIPLRPGGGGRKAQGRRRCKEHRSHDELLPKQIAKRPSFTLRAHCALQ